MFNKKGCCNRQGFGFNQPFNKNQGMASPIVEPTITTCDQKDFYCEVPHV